MNELKPLPCPICGDELKIRGPEDWHPTPHDPDSGGDPYNAVCDCGFQYSNGSYDYAEFIACLNRRAQSANEPLEQMKAQPIEATASIVPEDEVLERERERVREELRAQIADAETRAREAAEKLEQAKNPVAAQVNFLFVEISGLCARMSESYGTLENTQEETAGKFGEAIKRFFEGQAVRYGG